MNQLTMLGGLHGDKVRPFSVGDVVVSRGVAYVVESVTDAYAKPALVCIRVDAPGAGNVAIKFESEIDYRRGS